MICVIFSLFKEYSYERIYYNYDFLHTDHASNCNSVINNPVLNQETICYLIDDTLDLQNKVINIFELGNKYSIISSEITCYFARFILVNSTLQNGIINIDKIMTEQQLIECSFAFASPIMMWNNSKLINITIMGSIELPTNIDEQQSKLRQNSMYHDFDIESSRIVIQPVMYSDSKEISKFSNLNTSLFKTNYSETLAFFQDFYNDSITNTAQFVNFNVTKYDYQNRFVELHYQIKNAYYFENQRAQFHKDYIKCQKYMYNTSRNFDQIKETFTKFQQLYTDGESVYICENCSCKKCNVIIYDKLFTCATKCPNNTFTDDNFICLDEQRQNQQLKNHFENVKEQDPPFQYTVLFERKLKFQCEPGFYYSSDTQKCYKTCPDNYQIFNKKCIKCQEFFYSNNQTNNICLPFSCLKNQKLQKFSNGSVYCVDRCIIDYYNYQQMCIRECPRNTVGYDGECIHTCPYDMVNEQGFCTFDCPDGLFAYNGQCLKECPQYLIQDKEIKKCINIYTEQNLSYCEIKYSKHTQIGKHFLRYFNFDDKELINDIFCFEVATVFTGNLPGNFFFQVKHQTENSSVYINYYVPKCPQFLHTDYVSMRCEYHCKGKLNLRSVCVSFCPDQYFEDNGNCIFKCPRNTDYINRSCTDSCTQYGHYPMQKECRPCFLEQGCYLFQLLDKNQQLSAQEQPCGTGMRQMLDNVCFAQNKCLSTIAPYYQEGDCVDTCGYGYVKESSLHQCLAKCPPFLTLHKQQQVCYIQCPNAMFKMNGFCTDICPDTYFIDAPQKCVKACSPSQYVDLPNHKCLATCPDGFIGYDYRCIEKCPIYMFLQQNRCVLQCIGNYVISGNTCITVNDFFKNKTQEQLREIENVCGIRDHIYNNLKEQMCVHSYRAHPDMILNNHIILPICPDISFKCYMLCFTNCTSEGLFTDNTSRRCLHNCPTFTHPDKNNEYCISTCPTGQFIIDNGTCVEQCPANTFYDNKLKRCGSNCSHGFIDVSTRMCVEKCRKYSNFENKTCVSQCPDNLYADNINMACVSACPKPLVADQLSKKCQLNCSENYFEQDGHCVIICDGYYDYDARKCVKACYPGQTSLGLTNICVTEHISTKTIINSSTYQKQKDFDHRHYIIFWITLWLLIAAIWCFVK